MIPKATGSRPRRPLTDAAQLGAVIDAIDKFDIQSSSAWKDLDALSERTSVDEIQVVPEGIFTTDEGFTAVATVYVILGYGDKNDATSTTESFPAQVEGHFENDAPRLKAIVDRFSVDTSSFNE